MLMVITSLSFILDRLFISPTIDGNIGCSC